LSGVKTKISKVRNFIETDVWDIQLSDLPKSKAFLIRQLRLLLLTIRGFKEDKCQIRASGLTFYSLLSIVPLIAMFFGIAKGFGFEQLLEKQIREKFSQNQEIVHMLVDFSHRMLENTNGGLIAGVGVILIFWTVLKLLGNIEISFNAIWGLKKNRTHYRKFTDYLSVMLIAPVLLIISSSTMVFVSTQFSGIIERFEILGPIGSVLLFVLRLLPFVLIWGLFTLVYIVMPNTKVNIRSGLFAGIIAGTVYQFVQWIYIRFQIGVANANAIYGSFAVLPLFLIWMQLSWMIVLFGAEISHSIQKIEELKFQIRPLEMNLFNKKILYLLIMHHSVKKFMKGEESFTISQINNDLEIPPQLVGELVDDLVEARILSTIFIGEDEDPRYQPATDINRLSIEYVLRALDKSGTDDMPTESTEKLNEIREALEDFNNLLLNSPYNKLLKNI
jgi:membrane protein